MHSCSGCIAARDAQLLGLSGLTGDMRDLLAERKETGNRRAALALSIFCLRVGKYIGAYLARMGGAEAIVFKGGIGEKCARSAIADPRALDFMGIRIDERANERCTGRVTGRISPEGSGPEIHVIPTDEEILIARDTVRCLS